MSAQVVRTATGLWVVGLAGGVYNTTGPTLADQATGELQLGIKGDLLVGMGSNVALGDAQVLPGMLNSKDGSFRPLGVHNFLYNGTGSNGMERQRNPVKFVPFASTAITAGTGATIWTPGAGKKFRLMGWLISSSAAGQLIFGDNLVATVIARSEAVIAAGTSNVPSDALGNGILSAAANNVLKLDGPTGNVAGMVWGTEE